MPLVKKSLLQLVKPIALLGFASRSLIFIMTFGLIFFGAVGVSVYYYLQYQQTESQLNKTTRANEQSTLIEAVGKLIVLPTDEQPTIATVSDVTKLKSQPFFSHAQNGDKVLIYTKAQEAILYDSIANKIVEVGPVSLTQVSPTQSAGSGVTPSLGPVKVAIYNGTSVVGVASKEVLLLKQQLPNVTIVAKADAQKSTYTTTIITDITGKEASQAAVVAKVLNGKVGILPAGEVKPASAEIVVILGK